MVFIRRKTDIVKENDLVDLVTFKPILVSKSWTYLKVTSNEKDHWLNDYHVLNEKIDKT